ncbi:MULTISPECIES: 5-(carboxyamino)imidazole ribonucleotide synthase [Planococcus]|uniref:N5-carboxyaminoimidazole ribonucleotide synthase n=1 Tax=Planococcus faecalis TaxID=1598147 RepID=A0ABM6ISR7_9BACL|nr:MULTISPECIES: 5-(carboxyamino)imidazole ribonucleotide synthase [Planococcus]AQU78616.1 5-(carboxyamino)imidazole ribonucleotide synthase [Planococcus faecalis]MDJ0333217.1 5-(carboxyamino)imidazole ribonucleotide synthase [Planococcus sp. S3-L1]OHX54447.1 5-(carboxyamino)imidazole ribonucleotide synthase [Planococcus faecalis]
MTKTILPGQTIGIIGGGQLGRMMALAAKEAGFKIAVLDPAMDSPTGQVADIQIVAPFNDQHALEELAEVSDVITYEFENIDVEGLSKLAEIAYVPQGSELIRVTQNRIVEKQAISEAGAVVADYVTASTFEELKEKSSQLSFPFVVKTARGGYDGKGQQTVSSIEELSLAKRLFTNGECVAEAFVEFTKEISVIIQRNVHGETAILPIGENIHKDHILHETIVPARIDKKTIDEAKKAAEKIATHLNMVGTLAVEMFVLEDGGIIVNELAPRPHNSGHYSIEATNISQFHQHIRAICGWPLRQPILWSQAVMVNVLGEHVAPLASKIAQFPNWSIHLYGKDEAKQKRKMGHVTILTEDLEATLGEIDRSGIWPE